MSERLRICLVRNDPGSRHIQPLFREFEERFEVTTYRVEDPEETLPKSLDELGDVGDCDAIVWLVFYRLLRDAPGFDWQGYKGLRLWYEFDAIQNFRSIASSRNKGTFPGTFRRMQFDMMVSTGRLTRDLMEEEGVRSYWIPKGYDGEALFDTGRSQRDGVGHYGSMYPARRAMLAKVGRAGITVENFRVIYGELNQQLNQFLACIVCNMDLRGSGVVPVRAWKHIPEVLHRERPGLEPMIKNYEVAGAGCAPICDYYPELDDLGFIDGETMVFYRTYSELNEKLRHYLASPDELDRIGRNASKLVSSRHTWRHRMDNFDRLIRSEAGGEREPG
jgi:hypothetical protein